MMAKSASSNKHQSKGAVSRRRVLRTAGVIAGTGISTTLLGTSPVGAQQTLDFGEVAVGSSDTQTVSQPNPTDQTLPITGIEITGSNADQFRVVDGDAPFTLQADESQAITIQFAPTSTGEKSASVQVEIAGGTTQTAGQLTGTGVNETGGQNEDDSATDESSSSSQEVATETSDDGASEATSMTRAEAGESQSTGDESSAEDSVASPSATDESTPTADDSPSIILMLDFNDNGVIDLQDIMTLLRILG